MRWCRLLGRPAMKASRSVVVTSAQAVTGRDALRWSVRSRKILSWDSIVVSLIGRRPAWWAVCRDSSRVRVNSPTAGAS